MARIATLLFLVGHGACIQMRETVERTVMVRTTGSDLQPAATGYIYKKESDGPASVVKMGETEVMEHFTKFYGKPEAYKAPAPVPAGPFYAKEGDDAKAASHTNEEQVKPVVEHAEHNDDHIDGIADEDYDKIFEEYTKQLRDDKENYGDDYLHGLGRFDHDVYHGYGGKKDYDADGYHGYKDKEYKGYGHHYNKGNEGDYHRQKHEGYSVSKEGGHKNGYDGSDDHGKHYGHGYNGGHHGHKTDYKDDGHGFHKVLDHNEYKKGNEFYGGRAHDDGRHGHGDAHGHESQSRGYKEGASHDSGHHDDGIGKGFVERGSGDHAHSSEQEGESDHHSDGNFGAKNRQYDGKSFGYEIKH